MVDPMAAKVESVVRYAATLLAQGQHRSGPELADHLNAKGFQTSYGTPFAGRRGTYAFVRAAYRRLGNEGRQADADNVAEAYVRPAGRYASDK